MDIYQHLDNIFSKESGLTIFELGVHVGQDTVRLLEKLDVLEYYGFECDPRSIQIIKNKGLHKKIKLIEKAVSDQAGTSTFYKSNGHPPAHLRNNTASSSIFKPTNNLHKNWPWITFEEPIEVKTISLDEVYEVADIGAIDFIWCDIQGAEYNMILGGQNTLSNTRYLFTEYSNTEFYSGQKELKDLLAVMPGRWSVTDLDSDVLLKNEALNG